MAISAEQSPQYRHQRQISLVVPPAGKLPRVLVHTTGRHQRINLRACIGVTTGSSI